MFSIVSKQSTSTIKIGRDKPNWTFAETQQIRTERQVVILRQETKQPEYRVWHSKISFLKYLRHVPWSAGDKRLIRACWWLTALYCLRQCNISALTGTVKTFRLRQRWVWFSGRSVSWEPARIHLCLGSSNRWSFLLFLGPEPGDGADNDL